MRRHGVTPTTIRYDDGAEVGYRWFASVPPHDEVRTPSWVTSR